MESQVEVDALVKHIREEVQRHHDGSLASGSGPDSSPTDSEMSRAASLSELPPFPDADGFAHASAALLAQTNQSLARAQAKHEVGAGVPKVFRSLYRNQGGYNVAVLKAIESLRDANQQLTAENARLRVYVASQAEWVKSVLGGVGNLQERLLGLERQNDHDQRWLKTLQAQDEEQRAQVDKLRAQLSVGTRETHDEIDRLTEHQKRLDRAFSRLDDRQTTDASFLKHQFWLTQSRASATRPVKDREQTAERSADGANGAADNTFANSENASDQDALYVAFENVFRGSRQDIKQRLEVYLPHLRDAQIGGSEKPVLDLGCGRGEWLELLREQGFTASGVDLNFCMVEACRERGLSAVRANVLEHLASLPAESLGAVTAFHLIEHLPRPLLLNFFRECRRVLKPGGMAIFETPNPYNLMVGASRFYDDHTHERPLPPNSTRFLVEQAGFKRADILPLHPREDAEKVHGDGTNPALVERFNELFYGPEDYALLSFVSA